MNVQMATGNSPSTMSQALTFSHVSDQPGQYLHAKQYETPSPGKNEVLVRMLMAPINPLDVMVLAGKYPVKPANHVGDDAIPGYDGVAEILQCGEGVEELKIGEWVIPKQHGLGTWRTHAVFQEDSLLKVSSAVDPKFAATLRMCVAPAYLLLEDMKQLKPGDWIIQNAASGIVAQMVSQFARLKGVQTISIIRDRADPQSSEERKRQLLHLGADLVLTESELAASEPLSKSRRITLALDSVFGAQAAILAGNLSPNGLFVNYGSLGGGSGSFGLSQDLLFWKQLTFRNFRLSACMGTRSEAEIRDMMVWFVNLFEKGALKAADVDTVLWHSKVAKTATDDIGVHLVQAVVRTGASGVGEAKKQLFQFRY